MAAFNVNFSSSPASQILPSSNTPSRRQNIFSQPQDIASTTPLAPPPSQPFGSSALGSGVSKLQFQRGSSNPSSSAPRRSTSSRAARNGTFQHAGNRTFQSSTSFNEAEEEYSDDGMMNDDTDGSGLGQNGPSLKFNTASIRRQYPSKMRPQTAAQSRSRLPRSGRADIIPRLAKDVSKRMKLAPITESDTVVIETDQVIEELENALRSEQEDDSTEIVVSGAAQELIAVWAKAAENPAIAPDQGHIGPMPNQAPFVKARYMATLLLELHHPKGHIVDDSRSMVLADGRASVSRIKTQPTPAVIFEWINRHHINYDPVFEKVLIQRPNCTSSDLFWDAIEALTMRGKLHEVMRLLAEADFKHAVVDTASGTQRADFSGTQLQAIQAAVYQARQVLNQCPAVQDGDWDIGGPQWNAYRSYVENSLQDLSELADDQNADNESTQNSQDFFGRSSNKSGLPFAVYAHIRTVYNILLGDVSEITGLAQDWLEASLMLTAWWNSTEIAKVAQWSFDVSKANNESAEINPLDPYLTRLRDSFLCVTDPAAPAFQVNSLSPMEVGLGAVLQGDKASVITILERLSLTISSAVAELGTWAGWLITKPSAAELDQDDLMVLNYGNGNGNDDNSQNSTKDDILTNYATALFDRDWFMADNDNQIAGWELAFSVISRMTDDKRLRATAARFTELIPVSDRDKAERLVIVCQQLGLQEESRKVSESFGDHLAANTSEYGTALLCYARAHNGVKVRQLIDLLNSYCLVQSSAYPRESDMDPALLQLVSDPRQALANITEMDPIAAEALQFHLTGYACLRRYFSIRDESSADADDRSARHRPLARRKAAARILISAIGSAADSIYGGLYDTERQSAIQVDCLLPLLGEASALLNEDNAQRVYTAEQLYALLAAIEDLQTVGVRVFQATEECMEASMQNFRGSQPPSPHAMLKKSVSSGTNSNFSFSLMGSEMLSRSEESLGGKSMGSAVLVGSQHSGRRQEDVLRGWDWRARFEPLGPRGQDVLKHLRISIARELSLAMLDEENTKI